MTPSSLEVDTDSIKIENSNGDNVTEQFSISNPKNGSFIVSKDKLDTISLNIVNTAVINEQYFMCLADGSLLVMDVRFGRIFK